MNGKLNRTLLNKQKTDGRKYEYLDTIKFKERKNNPTEKYRMFRKRTRDRLTFDF